MKMKIHKLKKHNYKDPQAEETQPNRREMFHVKHLKKKMYEKFWIQETFNSHDELLKSNVDLESLLEEKKMNLEMKLLDELSEEAIGEAPEEYTLPPLPDGVTEEDGSRKSNV